MNLNQIHEYERVHGGLFKNETNPLEKGRKIIALKGFVRSGSDKQEGTCLLELFHKKSTRGGSVHGTIKILNSKEIAAFRQSNITSFILNPWEIF